MTDDNMIPDPKPVIDLQTTPAGTILVLRGEVVLIDSRGLIMPIGKMPPVGPPPPPAPPAPPSPPVEEEVKRPFGNGSRKRSRSDGRYSEEEPSSQPKGKPRLRILIGLPPAEDKQKSEYPAKHGVRSGQGNPETDYVDDDGNIRSIFK